MSKNTPPLYSKASDSFNQNVGEPQEIELITISMPGRWYRGSYHRKKNPKNGRKKSKSE